MMQAFSRRQMLQSVGGGLGMLALADLLNAGSSAQRAPHFAPKAKRVIHLFMNGGPFQADLFDPKPAINSYAGQRPPGGRAAHRTPDRRADGRPVQVRQARPERRRGQRAAAADWPRCIDDICVLRSLHTDNPNHGPALFLMNNGTITPTRPSMGVVALLRPRHREREPAGLRRALPRPAGALRRVVVERLPAGRASGDVHQSHRTSTRSR